MHALIMKSHYADLPGWNICRKHLDLLVNYTILHAWKWLFCAIL